MIKAIISSSTNAAQDEPLLLSFNAIRYEGDWFLDESNRKILIRGKNFLSDTILKPSEQLLEHAPQIFSDYIKQGHRALRMNLSWKELEKEPGNLCPEYLHFIQKLMGLAKKFGLFIFLDLNLDQWRHAPLKLIEAVGFDTSYFPNQHHELIYQTMNTLFFDSETYAPKLIIDELSATEYLQRAYCRMLINLFSEFKDASNLFSINLLSQPSMGFIGNRNIKHTAYPLFLKGEGYDETLRAWRDDRSCIWRNHQVWQIDEKGRPLLSRKGYFDAGKYWKQRIANRFFSRAARAIDSRPNQIYLSIPADYQEPIKLNSSLEKKRLKSFYLPHKIKHRYRPTHFYFNPYHKAKPSITNIFHSRDDKLPPYIQQLSGKRHRMHFDSKRRRFSLKYRGNQKQPLALFIPEKTYQNEFKVTVSNGSMSFDERRRLLYLAPLNNKKSLRLTIEPVTQEDPKGEGVMAWLAKYLKSFWVSTFSQ